MRKLFSFRSSGVSHSDVQHNRRINSPDDAKGTSQATKSYEDFEQQRHLGCSSRPQFTRSLSFSHDPPYGRSPSGLIDHGLSECLESAGNSPFEGAEISNHYHSVGIEEYKSRRHDVASFGYTRSSDCSSHEGFTEKRCFMGKPPRIHSTTLSSPTFSSARKKLNRTESELEMRTRRLEKEKNELQLSLEKELDRRSADWSLKVEKFQVEEHRLRERVRELAEQNVSLQREVSALKGNEADSRNKFMDLQVELNDLASSLSDTKQENDQLRRALEELQDHYQGIEKDMDCIRRSYNEKDKDVKDFQGLVVQLQRICADQDKTISGLRLNFVHDNGKQSVGSDFINQLQVEQLRLTCVEQKLRKEVESSQQKLESLRRENVFLLERLRRADSDNGFFPYKIDQELCTQLDRLQTQGLLLLNDNSHFCGELLTFIKSILSETAQESSNLIGGYQVLGYSSKYQSLRNRIDSFNRTLQTMAQILEMKSDLESSTCQSLIGENNTLRWLKDKDRFDLELKAEAVLTRVLQEKLLSRELELEQLQEDFASSVRIHEIQQAEMLRTLDELSHLRQKARNIQIEMDKGDETNKKLRLDLQEQANELSSTLCTLSKVSEERDRIWEDVKRSRETIMLLEHEVNSLRKKIEALDEEVLMKEGQIAILKDTLGSRQFDLINSSPRKPPKEFSLKGVS